MYKKSSINNQGITLIALVITIIILLILAGITITTLTGDNGILNKTNLAGEETKKKEYEEVLKIIGNGLKPDKIVNYETSEVYMEKYSQEIKKDETFKASKVELNKQKDPITIVVETKEGYIYWVTEKKVEYVGKKGENPPPDLLPPLSPEEGEGSNMKFTYTPSTWTNGDVEVEIVTQIEGYTLQYSTDFVIWRDYTAPIVMQENGNIYARLSNRLEETGGYATGNVSNIDRELPESAEISFDKNQVNIGENIIATVIQSDELSGINIEKSRWIFTKSNHAIGVDNIEEYTGEFKTEEKNKLTLTCSSGGTYYLHILSVDNAGNLKETISTEGVTCTAMYLNVNSVWSDTFSFSDPPGWSLINNDTYLYKRCLGTRRGYGWTYLVSTALYDLTDVSRLTFSCRSVNNGMNNTFDKPSFGLEILNASDAIILSNYQTFPVHVTPPNTLYLDVSSIKGSYKLRIALCIESTGGIPSGHSYFNVQPPMYLKGE